MYHNSTIESKYGIFVYFFDRYLNSKYIISFLILLTPFTMGEILPFIASAYTKVALICSLLLFFLYFESIIHHRRQLKTNFTFPTILFALSFIFSMVFGEPYVDLTQYTIYDSSFGGVLFDIANFLPVQLILVFIIFKTIARIDDLIYYLKIILISGCIVNFIGILLYVMYIGNSSPGSRLGATFSDPNYLGRFEVFIISISLIFAMNKDLGVTKRVLLFINIIPSLYLLYSTFSRSAIITLGLVVIIVLFFNKSKVVKYGLGSLVVLMIILALTVVGNQRSGDVMGSEGNVGTSMMDYSNTTRLALNYASYKMFLDYPIFGVGYHNFYNMYINRAYIPIEIPAMMHVSVVHSWLFAVMGEQGLIGLISLMWILILVTSNLFGRLRRTQNSKFKTVGLALFALFFVMIFNGLFFPVFFPELMTPILFGMIGGFLKLKEI